MKYGSTYRQIAEELYGDDLPKSGIPSSVMSDEEVRLGIPLPPALREYYEILGTFQRLNTAQDQLLSPAELIIADNVLVFLNENQGVFAWGVRVCDLAEADPLVWQSADTEWFEAGGVALSDFLRDMIYLQTSGGGFDYLGIHEEEDEVMPEVSRTWKKVVDINGLHIWMNGSSLIRNSEGDNICMCAARTKADFAVLEAQHGFDPL